MYGFYAVSYLADLVDCVALFDPERELARLAEPIAAYPEKLRAAIVQNALWGAEFSLRQGPGFAARGDVYDTVGLLTRVCAYLTQALFALNERYFANDKHAMATIAGFELRPADYPSRVAALLAAPGRTAAQLAASVAALDSLFREVGELAGPLYRVRHP